MYIYMNIYIYIYICVQHVHETRPWHIGCRYYLHLYLCRKRALYMCKRALYKCKKSLYMRGLGKSVVLTRIPLLLDFFVYIYKYMYVYIYTNVYIHALIHTYIIYHLSKHGLGLLRVASPTTCLSLLNFLYIYMYIYMYIYTCIYLCICIYV